MTKPGRCQFQYIPFMLTTGGAPFAFIAARGMARALVIAGRLVFDTRTVRVMEICCQSGGLLFDKGILKNDYV